MAIFRLFNQLLDLVILAGLMYLLWTQQWEQLTATSAMLCAACVIIRLRNPNWNGTP